MEYLLGFFIGGLTGVFWMCLVQINKKNNYYNFNEITDETKFGIPKLFIKQCLETFDNSSQIDILQEECAELIKECSDLIKICSKIKRSGELQTIPIVLLTEEMAHVLISSAVVSELLNITEEDILDEVNKKANKYNFKLDGE